MKKKLVVVLTALFVLVAVAVPAGSTLAEDGGYSGAEDFVPEGSMINGMDGVEPYASPSLESKEPEENLSPDATEFIPPDSAAINEAEQSALSALGVGSNIDAQAQIAAQPEPEMPLIARAAGANLNIADGDIIFDLDGSGVFYSQGGAPGTYYDPSAGSIRIYGNSSNTITVKEGSHSFLVADLKITSASAPPISLESGASLTLTTDGTNSTLTATGAGFAGIQIPSGASLNISGNGQLYAYGGAGGAGFGGGTGQSGGSMTFNASVSIEAKGGADAAGIGGGSGGNGETITLNHATVISQGSGGGAGIGGGKDGNSGNITIDGGNVFGSTGYTGIGGGEGGTCGNIKILNGATVRALSTLTTGNAIGSGTSDAQSGTLEVEGDSLLSLAKSDSNHINAVQQLGTCILEYANGLNINSEKHYYRKLTLVGANAAPEKDPNGKTEIFKDGTNVTITADIPADKVFSRWETTDSSVILANTATASFSMPKNALAITAVFENKSVPTSTPTPSSTPTPTPSSTPTPTPSSTPTPAPSPTPTPTPSPTPTPTPSPTPTSSPLPSQEPEEDEILHVIVVTYSEGGTVRLATDNVQMVEESGNSFYVLTKKEGDISFDITSADGWYLSGVFVDDERVAADSGTYTFQNIQQNHRLRVEFEKKGAPKTDDSTKPWVLLLLAVTTAAVLAVCCVRRPKEAKVRSSEKR